VRLWVPTPASVQVARGVFGAHMLVELECDGPVTIIL
jgi:D-Tyr-tRNAtyr deacylase